VLGLQGASPHCSEIGKPLHCFRTATDVSLARRRRLCRRIELTLPILQWHRMDTALTGPAMMQDCKFTVRLPHSELHGNATATASRQACHGPGIGPGQQRFWANIVTASAATFVSSLCWYLRSCFEDEATWLQRSSPQCIDHHQVNQRIQTLFIRLTHERHG